MIHKILDLSVNLLQNLENGGQSEEFLVDQMQNLVNKIRQEVAIQRSVDIELNSLKKVKDENISNLKIIENLKTKISELLSVNSQIQSKIIVQEETLNYESITKSIDVIIAQINEVKQFNQKNYERFKILIEDTFQKNQNIDSFFNGFKEISSLETDSIQELILSIKDNLIDVLDSFFRNYLVQSELEKLVSFHLDSEISKLKIEIQRQIKSSICAKEHSLEVSNTLIEFKNENEILKNQFNDKIIFYESAVNEKQKEITDLKCQVVVNQSHFENIKMEVINFCHSQIKKSILSKSFKKKVESFNFDTYRISELLREMVDEIENNYLEILKNGMGSYFTEDFIASKNTFKDVILYIAKKFVSNMIKIDDLEKFINQNSNDYTKLTEKFHNQICDYEKIESNLKSEIEKYQMNYVDRRVIKSLLIKIFDNHSKKSIRSDAIETVLNILDYNFEERIKIRGFKVPKNLSLNSTRSIISSNEVSNSFFK